MVGLSMQNWVVLGIVRVVKPHPHKQHCRMLQVEQFLRQSRMLLRHCLLLCCRFWQQCLSRTKFHTVDDVETNLTCSICFDFCRKDEISFDIFAETGSKFSTFLPWLRPWLLEPKNNQIEIMKQYLLRNLLLFENYRQEVGGPIGLPPLNLKAPVSPGPFCCCAYVSNYLRLIKPLEPLKLRTITSDRFRGKLELETLASRNILAILYTCPSTVDCWRSSSWGDGQAGISVSRVSNDQSSAYLRLDTPSPWSVQTAGPETR